MHDPVQIECCEARVSEAIMYMIFIAKDEG